MSRTWLILMASTALLMGCSSGDSTPTTVTVTESPTAAPPAASPSAHPTEADFFSEQFHPCEVFSEEQLQQAGLGKRSNAAENPESVVKSCGFGVPHSAVQRGTFLVATDRLNRQKVNELGLESIGRLNAELEDIYVHSKTEESADCIAAYDFEWGRFIVHYGVFSDEGKSHDQCDKPVDVLESLILQGGGIHGTEDR